MRKLIVVTIVCLAVLGAVSAQGWRRDDENDNLYNCELISTLKDEAGAESLMRTEEGDQQSLAGFLDHMFPECVQQESLRLAELIESEEEEWVVVLYDRVSHEWGEPECSILIDDFYDEHFTFIIGGRRLDGLALDVYLPGDLEAVEMDYVDEDIVRGVPVRRELLGGAEFPLGQYVFDVHVDGDIYHFLWERTDSSMNTVSLSCLGRQEEAEDGSEQSDAAADAETPDGAVAEARESEPAESEDETENVTVLENDELIAIFDEQCVLALDSSDDEYFNLSIAAIDRGDLALDVYLPGQDEPFKTDEADEHSLSLGESESAQSEWTASDDFPLGMYTFHVHINDGTWLFQWDRQDTAGRIFLLKCFHAAVADDDPLKDGEKTYIPDTPCLVWTEAWDVDLNILVIGENLDEISVEIAFPGEEEPEDIDGVTSNSFEDGRPYRVEWIEGTAFPLGLFNIHVMIAGQLYPYQWQREDHSVNTFGVECITVEDE